MQTYDTLSEAVNDLVRRGYGFNFNIKKNYIECLENGIHLQPDEFKIDEVYRFEGMTDPGDEDILFAISSAQHHLKGTLVNAFGVYADTASAELIAKLRPPFERAQRPNGHHNTEMELAMATPKSFATRSDLPSETREKMIALLNQQLAGSFDLYSQTKHAHWNVKGVEFYELHGLFDKLAEMLEDSIDAIAERATALGGVAMGTVRMAAPASRVPEYPVDAIDSLATVEALATRYGHLAAAMRAAIDTAAQQVIWELRICSLRYRASWIKRYGFWKHICRSESQVII